MKREEQVTNYATAFVKWKCSHCGKIEYWPTGTHGPFSGLGCKKAPMTYIGRGGHSWVSVGVGQKKPKGK